MPFLVDVSENRNSFSGVHPGSPSTIDIPQSRGFLHEAYYEFRESDALVSRAAMEAALESVEILIDGKRYSEYFVKDILMLEDFRGEEFVPGILPLRFKDNTRRTILEAEETSFLPSAHKDPKLRLNIKGSATSPTLKQYLVSEGVSNLLHGVENDVPSAAAQQTIKHFNYTIDVTSQGETPTRWHFPSGKERIRGIHLQGDNIDRIVIFWDGQIRWEFDSLDQLNRLLKSNGFAPQADNWHFVPEALNGGSFDSSIVQDWNGQDHEMYFEIYTSNMTSNVRALVELYDIPPTRRNKA